MARAAQLVPVEEYLRTEYDPDWDYVDGELVERNLGERDHGELQGEIYTYLKARSKQLGMYVIIGQRIKISPTRYRVPDICVVLGSRPQEQVFTRPPFVAVEILSPEDRMSRMQQKIDDYFALGIRYVWLVDPQSRRAWVYTGEGMREATDGILRTADPVIELPLPEIFQAIDSM